MDDEPNDTPADDTPEADEQPAGEQPPEQSDEQPAEGTEQPADSEQPADQSEEPSPADDQPPEQSEEQPAESDQPAEQSEEQPADIDQSEDQPAEQSGDEPAAAASVPAAATGTHTSVRNGFLAFSQPLEGRVRWMYLDIKGLVTTGVGNLIDPVTSALKLPFVHKSDGSPANEAEIGAEWQRLKGNQALAQKGHTACEAITELRLTDVAVDQLVLAKFDGNDRVLRQAFSNWNEWPADAQLGAHSMAWAGAGFPVKWPKFKAAAEARNWKAVAAESHIDETGNPGVKARSAAHDQLFHNADVVESSDLDRATLHYPQTLLA
jgi:hypothetical protein